MLQVNATVMFFFFLPASISPSADYSKKIRLIAFSHIQTNVRKSLIRNAYEKGDAQHLAMSRRADPAAPVPARPPPGVPGERRLSHMSPGGNEHLQRSLRHQGTVDGPLRLRV